MKRIILTVAALALLAPALAQQSGLKATFDTLWVRMWDGETTSLSTIRAKLDTWAVPPKWWVMYYADSVAGGGGGGTDTNAFHHDSRADSSETLFARTVVVDTIFAYPNAALTVAGSAWVRDTVTADVIFYERDTIVGLDTFWFQTIVGHTDDGLSSGVWTYWLSGSDKRDTITRFYLGGGSAAWIEYHNNGHTSLMGWDGFDNVDTVHKDVSGNPARRAFHGFAWNDTGMTNDGTGFAGIWQYESTRVVAMAETASGGVNSFVAAIGSATGNFADTSYISSTLGIYTNTAAGFVGVGAVVPGQIIDWYGDSSAFPTGYVLCDGTRKFKNANGDSVVTPDLRNFFTIGASIDTGNGIPMSSIEDTTGAAAKATGGSVKYTPAGAVSVLGNHTLNSAVPADGERFGNDEADLTHDPQTFTGTRAVLVQPYVAVWKLIRSRTY